LAHANLLQLVVRDHGLLSCNKMSQPVGNMLVNGTRSAFLMSVVPVTFGPICPWFCTAR